jgi:Tol biopolymer transport system component
MRDGDLDIYSMKPDGSDVRRLTDEVGYDGGPFYSPDGSKIVYRAHRPSTTEDIADYTALLADGLIRPSELEIFVMNSDGSGQTEITHNGAANFGPFWHPSGSKIIFASNMDDPTGRDFDLYMIDEDGWGSNRNQAREGETNVFIAEWVE